MKFKSVNFEVKEADATTGEFAGYASTWDKDQGDDIIVQGAFSETLKSNFDRVKILWQHDSNTPIGKPAVMREDDRGLYVEGKISETQQGKDAAILMRDGVIDQMSIGFLIPEGKATVKDGIRYIEQVELYEFSLVTWPMNEAAVITAVKELRPKEIERVLREAGLTSSQAKCVTNKGLSGLREAQEQATEEQLKELKNAIDSLTITTKLKV